MNRRTRTVLDLLVHAQLHDRSAVHGDRVHAGQDQAAVTWQDGCDEAPRSLCDFRTPHRVVGRAALHEGLDARNKVRNNAGDGGEVLALYQRQSRS